MANRQEHPNWTAKKFGESVQKWMSQKMPENHKSVGDAMTQLLDLSENGIHKTNRPFERRHKAF